MVTWLGAPAGLRTMLNTGVTIISSLLILCCMGVLCLFRWFYWLEFFGGVLLPCYLASCAGDMGGVIPMLWICCSRLDMVIVGLVWIFVWVNAGWWGCVPCCIDIVGRRSCYLLLCSSMNLVLSDLCVSLNIAFTS